MPTLTHIALLKLFIKSVSKTNVHAYNILIIANIGVTIIAENCIKCKRFLIFIENFTIVL